MLALIIQNQLRIAAITAVAFLCCDCSGRPTRGVLIASATSAEGTARVPELVATTRKPSTADAGEMFSGERAEAVSYASITVSIPPDSARKIGQVQWPASMPGDPSHDFVTVSADRIDKLSFNAAISSAVRSTGRSGVLVFVHGYNNRFDEAVYRLAQIVQDSKAPVIPVLFSWPSKGLLQLSAYKDDLESANASRIALAQLLDTIARNRDVKEVTVLCHSMGCWPALEVLRAKDKVKSVLLVAPDVDVDHFHAEVRRMGNPKPVIALFGSQDDHALKLSKMVWGGKARLGDVNPNEEPYRSEFRRDRVHVFDLTSMKGDSHSRAFEDMKSVMGMIEERLAEGQQMTDSESP